MSWLKLLQPILGILLMAAILLQSRGAGVSGIFGGSDNVFRTKRGIEKKLFTLTIIISITFFVVSFLTVIL